MKYVWIDKTDENKFHVSFFNIHGKQVRNFDNKEEADAFALKRMGKTGVIVDRTSKSTG